MFKREIKVVWEGSLESVLTDLISFMYHLYNNNNNREKPFHHKLAQVEDMKVFKVKYAGINYNFNQHFAL